MTLKTGSMATENSALPSQESITFKKYILLVYIPSLFDRCLTAPIWLFCRLCQTGRGLRWICRLICCAQHLVQSCFCWSVSGFLIIRLGPRWPPCRVAHYPQCSDVTSLWWRLAFEEHFSSSHQTCSLTVTFRKDPSHNLPWPPLSVC